MYYTINGYLLRLGEYSEQKTGLERSSPPWVPPGCSSRRSVARHEAPSILQSAGKQPRSRTPFCLDGSTWMLLRGGKSYCACAIFSANYPRPFNAGRITARAQFLAVSSRPSNFYHIQSSRPGKRELKVAPSNYKVRVCFAGFLVFCICLQLPVASAS